MTDLILTTPRLSLRTVSPDDLADVLEIFGDPLAVEQYAEPKDRDGCRAWIARILDRYERHGHGLWAVVLNETGENIGQCGLSTQAFRGFEELCLGWLLKRRHWGCGYATEAARACRGYARDRAMAPELASYIRPANSRSIAVAGRAGMRRVAELTAGDSAFGEPMSVYAVRLEPVRQGPRRAPVQP